ncbi:MAG: zf-HC2 domain-containing protein [Nannocystaceae bacterium]
MDCKDCEPRLIDYASHELREDERGGVARHLAGCSDCALEYCRLQADLEGIAEAHAEAPRAEAFQALRTKVAAEHRPAWWTRTWRLLALPVPMYGALLVSLVPAALWLAMASRQGPPASTAHEASTNAPSTPTLTHYDGTELPPALRDVL